MHHWMIQIIFKLFFFINHKLIKVTHNSTISLTSDKKFSTKVNRKKDESSYKKYDNTMYGIPMEYLNSVLPLRQLTFYVMMTLLQCVII